MNSGIQATAMHSGQRPLSLTQNDEQTDKYGGHGAVAQLDCHALLEYLAVVAVVPLGTLAHVQRLLVAANAAVLTRVVQTLVLVHAPFAVQGQNRPLLAACLVSTLVLGGNSENGFFKE